MLYVVKRKPYDDWAVGGGKWTHPTDRYSNELEHKAWHWAEKRSRDHPAIVYQVFESDEITLRGKPYYHGKVLNATPGEGVVYEAYFKMPNTAQWTAFDKSGPQKYEDLDALITRCKGCCFTGIHIVRIWRDSEIIYEGKPTNSELVAWLVNYNAGNTDNEPATQGQESEMQLSKPVNIPVKTMADKISAYLAERRAEHDDKVALAKERHAKRTMAFSQLFEAEPDRTVTNSSYAFELAVDVANEYRTQEQALEQLRTRPEFAEVGAYQPDTDAEKLLSVLNATSDETIEVSTESDLYRYL